MTQPAEPPKLTHEDVSRLLRDPSEVNRARIARKVGINLGVETLSPSERALAEEIVRLIANDAIVHVRIALAESVKSSPGLPRDIARKLAEDVDDVALPILQFSQSLTDEDLIELVRNGDTLRQSAIAKRERISVAVAETVMDHGDEDAVIVLLSNRRAVIREPGLTRALDRFGDQPPVADAMAHRQSLPPNIVERLVNLVSDELQAQLVARYNLAPSMADDLAVKTRERATKSMYGSNSSSSNPFLRARELAATRRLTSQAVLSALCHRDLPLFEACLAVMADIPLSNARVLLRDSGPLGLRALVQKANVPLRLLPMLRIALAVATELDPDLDDKDFVDQRREIARRVVSAFPDSRHEDIDGLLTRLDEFLAPPETVQGVVHYVA